MYKVLQKFLTLRCIVKSLNPTFLFYKLYDSKNYEDLFSELRELKKGIPFSFQDEKLWNVVFRMHEALSDSNLANPNLGTL